MPIVEMPGGVELEFPDSMSREAIRTAIRKKAPSGGRPGLSNAGPGNIQRLHEDQAKQYGALSLPPGEFRPGGQPGTPSSLGGYDPRSFAKDPESNALLGPKNIDAVARALGAIAQRPTQMLQQPPQTLGGRLSGLGELAATYSAMHGTPGGARPPTEIPPPVSPPVRLTDVVGPPPRTVGEFVAQQPRPPQPPAQPPRTVGEFVAQQPPPAAYVPPPELDPIRQGIEEAIAAHPPARSPSGPPDLTGAALSKRKPPSSPEGFNWETGEQSGPFPYHPPETSAQRASAQASIAEGVEVLQQPIQTVSASKRGTPLLAQPIRETDPLSVFVTKRGGFSRRGYEGETREMRGRGVPPGMVRNASTSLTNEELATEAFQAGYIAEPTADSLVRTLQEDTAAAAQGNPQGRILSYRGRELTQDQMIEEQARGYYEAQEQGLELAKEADPAKVRAAFQARGQGDLLDDIHRMRGGQPGERPEFTLTDKGPAVQHGEMLVDPAGKEASPKPVPQTLGEILQKTVTGEKGSTPIFNQVAAAPAEKIKGGISFLRFPWKRIVTNAEDVMTSKINGNEDTALLANAAKQVSDRTEQMAGDFQFHVTMALKGLSEDQVIHAEDFLDGRHELVPPGGLTEEEGVAAAKIRNLLDEYKAMGRQLGIEKDLKGEGGVLMTRRPDGSSVPFVGMENDYLARYMHPDMFKEGSPLQKEMEDFLVNERGLSRMQAQEHLVQEVSTARAKALKFGSLDRGRGKWDLPKKAYVTGLYKRLMIYGERAAFRLQMVKQFGPNNEWARALLDQAALTDPDAAAFARRKFDEFAKINVPDRELRDWTTKVTGAQVMMKLGPATALKTVSHLLLGAERTSFSSLVKALTHYQESKEIAMRAGQLLRSVERENLAMFGAGSDPKLMQGPRWSERYMRMVGHTKRNEVNRVLGSGMGRFYADELAGKLVANAGKDTGNTRFWYRRLQEMNVDVPTVLRLKKEIEDAGAPLSQAYLKEMAKAGQTVSNDFNYRHTVMSTPDVFNSPVGRVFTLFHDWMVRTAKFTNKHVVQEALKGNVNPLLVMLGPTGYLTGEFIQDGAAFLRWQNPFTDPQAGGGPIAKALGGQELTVGDLVSPYFMHGNLTLFNNIFDAVTRGSDSTMAFFEGPFVTQLSHTWRAIGQVVHRENAKKAATREAAWDPLWREALQEWTPMSGQIGRPLARELYPKAPARHHKTLGERLAQ